MNILNLTRAKAGIALDMQILKTVESITYIGCQDANAQPVVTDLHNVAETPFMLCSTHQGFRSLTYWHPLETHPLRIYINPQGVLLWASFDAGWSEHLRYELPLDPEGDAPDIKYTVDFLKSVIEFRGAGYDVGAVDLDALIQRFEFPMETLNIECH